VFDIPGIDIPVIIGNVAIPIGADADAADAAADAAAVAGPGPSPGPGFNIVDISVLITGNPIKPVFVIISPLCNVSAT
jgi:hypothetical protein